jgi:hypothetical protein
MPGRVMGMKQNRAVLPPMLALGILKASVAAGDTVATALLGFVELAVY